MVGSLLFLTFPAPSRRAVGSTGCLLTLPRSSRFRLVSLSSLKALMCTPIYPGRPGKRQPRPESFALRSKR
jgi:hypothetical protein